MRVVTTTVFNSIEESFTDASWCPPEPVYQDELLLENMQNIEGAARFLNQQSYTDLMDPCNWTCYEDKDGKC